jgi:hypothetical protein
MTSEFSIFSARVADFIAICAAELSSEHHENPDFWAKHADAEFNGMALMLFTLQFQHNRAYRKICEARGISPETTTHWMQIPTVPTSAFKELEISCLEPNQRTRVFHSSGTTAQQPSRHFHNVESLAIYDASLLAWFRFHVPPAKRLLVLTPPVANAPHSSLAQMFETIRRDFGAPEESFVGIVDGEGSWTVNFESAVGALENASRSGEQVVVMGTAFSFVHLLDYLTGKNLRFKLPPGSRVMETGGYKNRSRVLSKTELHALIAERLGVAKTEILCEYGMSELSSQAYAGENGIFRLPPWARAKIISPETGREVREGETGLLRIFDLANVFSAMAIQTEDLAIRRGAGFELIGRAALAEPRGCSLMTA